MDTLRDEPRKRVDGWVVALLMVALIAGILGIISPVRADAAELEITGQQALTTGTHTVAHNAYSEFYAPRGTITIRALDDGTTATTLAFVKWFATNPSSADLDASTRELTGIALQEGDVLTLTTTSAGYVGVDGATGTSQVWAGLKY